MKYNTLKKPIVFIVIILLIINSLILVYKKSYAAEIIATGMCGTCRWTIDSDGTLDIGGGVLASYTSESDETSDIPWKQYRDRIKRVTMNNKVTTGLGCNYLFYGLTNCTEFIISGLYAANTKNMRGMFAECTSLKKIDLTTIIIDNMPEYNQDQIDMYDLFKNDPLEEITLGYNFRFSINHSGILPNGMWKNKDASPDAQPLTTNQILKSSPPGTFVRVKNISDGLDIDEVVTYKIDLNEYDYSFTGDVINRDGVFYCRLPQGYGNNPRPCPLNASLTITYYDAAISADGRKNNVTIHIDNLMIYNYYDRTDRKLLEFYTKANMRNYYCNDNFERISVPDAWQRAGNVTYDVTISVEDGEGESEGKSFIFSAYDIDMPDGVDNYDSDYAEGMYLLEGFSRDKIKKSVDSILDIHTSGNGYTRIRGTEPDGRTEASMFMTVCSAYRTKFAWTAGRDCSTTILTEYNPTSATIIKTDGQDNLVEGAQLEVYKYINEESLFSEDNLIDGWSTSNYDHMSFWLNPGTYMLRETVAPIGYVKASDAKFYVESDGTIRSDNSDVYTYEDVGANGNYNVIELVNRPRNDVSYSVEHYLQNVNSTTGEIQDTYSLKDTDNLAGTNQMYASFSAKTYDGYAYKEEKTWPQVIEERIIKPDGSTVIKLYYDINSYKYSVEYYFDDIKDETLYEEENAAFSTKQSRNPEKNLVHNGKNYVLISDNHEITISSNPDNNIIKIYYKLNENNPDNPDNPDNPNNPDNPDNPNNPDNPDNPNNPDNPDNPDNPNNPDNPDNPNNPDNPDNPDNPNNPDNPDKPDNPNNPDNPDEPEGPGNSDKPSTPQGQDKPKDTDKPTNKPTANDQYTDNINQKNNDTSKTDGKTDVSEKSVKSNNPKTADTVQKYMICGFAGVGALMIAIRLKRKYGRKMKKIQF